MERFAAAGETALSVGLLLTRFRTCIRPLARGCWLAVLLAFPPPPTLCLCYDGELASTDALLVCCKVCNLPGSAAGLADPVASVIRTDCVFQVCAGPGYCIGRACIVLPNCLPCRPANPFATLFSPPREIPTSPCPNAPHPALLDSVCNLTEIYRLSLSVTRNSLRPFFRLPAWPPPAFSDAEG